MFVEDLSVFLNPDEHAELVSIALATGVRAIFDEPYAQGRVGDVGMASNQPRLTLASADVPTDYYGLPVVVRGVDYVIAAHEPGGSGISRIYLEKP